MNTYAGDMTAKQLWRTDPSMRPVNVLGIVSQTAGGDDLVVVLAGGAKTSVFTRTLEDRATIPAAAAVPVAMPAPVPASTTPAWVPVLIGAGLVGAVILYRESR